MYVKKHGRDFAFPDYEPKYPRSPDYKLEHVKVDLKIFVYDKSIEGIASLRLRSLKEGLRTIEIDAVDMTINWVKKDTTELDFMYDGSKLTVILDSELNKNQEIEISVSYKAKPKKGLYFVIPNEHYPNIVPQVWSQGETEDNRYWIPLYDYPNVKCTSELIIRVPKEFTAISNGRLISVNEDGDWKIWHWLMDKPHSTYLIAVAVGLFEFKKEEIDGIPLEYYVPKGRKEDIERSFKMTADIIKFFSEYTGVPYPWDKYTQVCVSEFIVGGMENTTLTILTDRTLHDEKAHIDFESEPLVAHEAAHQWFGDLVTTKDWANIWINESFATYMEALYRRKWKGEDEFIYRMIGNLDAYLREYSTRYARPIVTRVYKYSSEVFDAHSYPKGALVLHTLSNLIGENVFREVIKKFLEKYKFSVADTEDFRKVLEEVVGKDFEWFFDQYLYNAGHPVLSINYSYDPETQMLKINIKQTQPDDSWDVYRIKLEVEITTDDGKINKVFWITQKIQNIYIPLEKKPQRVCFNPRFTTFAVLNIEQGLEQWIDQLLHCEHVYCRVLAARGLAKFKSSKAVEALKRAVIEDKFWGVSYEAATTLGKIGTEEALESLLEAEEKVKHPRIRRAIMQALGNFKHSRAAEILTKVLQNDEESYYVRSEAASSLGKTKWEKAKEYLKPALTVPSHNDVITIGALRGLAEIGDDESFHIIKEYTKVGKPTLVRATAVTLMSHFPEKREAIEIIREASRDENYRIRAAAIMATREMMDPRLLPMLDEMTKDIDERIIRHARETAKKIRDHMQRGVEYQKLREEIEKIKEENRKLLERINKLEVKA